MFMSKFAYITLFTPTSENRGGPSALGYSLIANRPADIEVEIFSFNINCIGNENIQQIEKELHAKIHLLSQPFWYRFVSNPRHKMTFIRIFLNKHLLAYLNISEEDGKYIAKCMPDYVWWYPSELFKVPRSLSQFKHVITGPDCASLTPLRRMQQPWLYKSKLKKWAYFKLLDAALRTERLYQSENSLFHVVGMEDAFLLEKINPKLSVFFLLHPHYQLIDNPQVKFLNCPIKILFAGKKLELNQDETNSFVKLLVNQSSELSPYYSFTFLGKGWDDETECLSNNGYQCNNVEWVDDYVDFIAQFDIQITLLTIGAGTKGKVLDALSSGLLVIGSNVSLENIAVRNYDSCINYKHLFDIIQVLKDIPHNKQRYQAIAQKGMKQVRIYHSPQRISKRFFHFVIQYFNR